MSDQLIDPQANMQRQQGNDRGEPCQHSQNNQKFSFVLAKIYLRPGDWNTTGLPQLTGIPRYFFFINELLLLVLLVS